MPEVKACLKLPYEWNSPCYRHTLGMFDNNARGPDINYPLAMHPAITSGGVRCYGCMMRVGPAAKKNCGLVKIAIFYGQSFT